MNRSTASRLHQRLRARG
ncbi:hypothetical protein [Treponema sp.]